MTRPPSLSVIWFHGSVYLLMWTAHADALENFPECGFQRPASLLEVLDFNQILLARPLPGRAMVP